LSTLALIGVLCAALYAHTTLYQLVMWWRRRESANVSLALLGLGLFAVALGHVLLADAQSQAAGAIASRVTYAGVAISTGGGIDFVLGLAERRTRRIRIAVQVCAWSGALLAALGLWIDPTSVVPPPTWGFAWAPDYPAPPLSIVGRAMLVVAWIFGAGAAFVLRDHIRGAGIERRVFFALVLTLVAGAHDLAITVASLRSVYIVEYVAYFVLASASYTWLERFSRAGAELRAKNRALEASYGELQGREEELGRAQQLAAVGELASVMAHELRNPLSVIKNASAQLGRPTLAADDREAVLGILDDEVARLDRLIEHLLTFTKPIRLDERTVPVRGLLERALARVSRRPGIDVSVPEDGASTALIRADPELVEQALLHVLQNAFDAVGDRGSVRIGTEVDAERVCITIADSGAGMDGNVLAKATTPFFTTRDQGTGLGLAIVERIMRAHGSSIDLTSSERTVPRSSAPPSDAESSSAEARSAGRAASTADTSGTCVSLVFPRGEA
jgi:signal transduction histidine kinase